MFTPSKMYLFRVVLQEKLSELALFPLLEKADLQFVEFESVQPEGLELKKFPVSPEYENIKNIEEKLFAIDHVVHFKEHRPEITNYDFIRKTDHSEDIKRLGEFTDAYYSLLNRLNGKKNRLEELESASEKTRTFNQVDNVFNLDGSSVVFYRFGTMDQEQLLALRKGLERVPVILYPLSEKKDQCLTLVVGLIKNKAYVDSALRNHGWTDVDLAKEFHDISDVYKDIEGAKALLKNEIDALQKEMTALVSKDREYLFPKYWEFYYLRMLNDIKSFFKKSGDNVCMSFWSPASEKEKIVETIKRVTKNHCYIEGIEASRAEAYKAGKIHIPILFQNPVFFRPFQIFVSAYGPPAYKSIDPTPIFTITYMIMFGMMFSDLGHGAVILALGLFMVYNKRVKNWLKRVLGIKTTDFAKIFVYCGSSSMLFGLLFGSVFGYENLIPALWMHPIHNIMTIVAVSIGFGVFYIILGLIFNLINSFIVKDIRKGIFDNYGLLGALFYFGALGVFVYMQSGSGVLSLPVVFALLGLPVILLFFKGPILYLLKKEHEPFEGGIGMYFLESLIQTYELFIGYLNNSISFVRIGAFAIAHAGLFIGVFIIASMVGDPKGGGISDWIVLIVGNVFIIILEAFLSGIQAIRLQFYEFFTKFYRDGNLQFKPLKLK